MRSLAHNHIDNQNKHFQSIGSNRNRKPLRISRIEAEISVTSLVGEYLWTAVVRRNGQRIDQLFGRISHHIGVNTERVWLLAMGMAFEWRDRHAPGSRLLFRESRQRERRPRIA